MDDYSKNMKLGFFVILISALFTYVVFKVSGGNGFINSTIEVFAEFKDVKGLLVGNNVRYSGVKVGTVEKIEVNSDTTLLVTMSLSKDVVSFMRSSAEADIGTNGLVGNMLINLSPGVSTAPFIKEGDVIGVKQKIDLGTMMNSLSTTNDKITQITNTLLEITEKINNGSGSVAQLINDGSVAQNLSKVTSNLMATTQHLHSSSDQINTLLKDVSDGKGNLGYLLKDDSFRSEIESLSGSIDSLIDQGASPILLDLKQSSESIVRTSKELEKIAGNLETNEGVLGTVLNDTLMARELKMSIENLNNGTQKFDESMEALQHHWLLRGFFKKKKKEQEKKKNDQ